MIYNTVFSSTETYIEEKKSKFIANICHCETEEDAQKFISEVKSRHPQARHIVYAYRLRCNNISRYSDAGEPSGTAGRPLIDVITKENLNDICITVTRYFGGILLGAGGLTRAYVKSASNCVSASEIKTMIPSFHVIMRFDYSSYPKVVSAVSSVTGKTCVAEYSDDINLEADIPEKCYTSFCNILSEVFNGKNVVVSSEKIYSFYEG